MTLKTTIWGNILGKIDTWLVLWFAGYVCNTLAVSQTPCGDVFLHTCGWVALYMLMRCLPLERADGRHWAWLCAALGLWQVVFGMGQLVGLYSSGHHLYAVTGSFFNPAPYGAFIAMMLAVVMAVHKERGGRALGLVALAMAVILPAAWSRAALLAFAVCAVIVYRTCVWRNWRWVVGACAVAAVALYLVKRGSADSRMLMMLVSLQARADNIWLGVGTGGYLHALGEGQAAYFACHPDSAFIESVGVADLPFNEPLRMAVEQGIVGLVPFAVALGLAARRLWLAGSPLFHALVSLLVFSLFSYPFAIPAFCAMLTVIMAVAAGMGREPRFRPAMLCPLMASIVPGVAVYLALRPRVEAEKDYNRFAHIRDKAFVKDYYELLPLMGDNHRFLFDFGSLLRDCGRYNDSNAMLRRGASLSADPMFHIMMGRNYEDMCEYAKADSMYGHAFRMVPNRIYPLYRQMKLYEATGDTTRCKEMARKVLDFRVKVVSPATREMKVEANKIEKRRYCQIINQNKQL